MAVGGPVENWSQVDKSRVAGSQRTNSKCDMLIVLRVL